MVFGVVSDTSWPLIVSHKCGGTHLKCIDLSRGTGFPDFNIFHRPGGGGGLLSYRCSKCVGQPNWAGNPRPTPGLIPGHNAFSTLAKCEERKPLASSPLPLQTCIAIWPNQIDPFFNVKRIERIIVVRFLLRERERERKVLLWNVA